MNAARPLPRPAPRVSVLLPVRNAAATLAACLRSLQRQTLTDFELLAVDDGSDDGSAELLRRAAAGDPRIQLLQPGRVGLVAALNLAVDLARAPLLARMDADDVAHPQRLALQAAHLEAEPTLAVSACRVALFPPRLIQAGLREYVRWQNLCLSPEDVAREIYVEAPFAHPSVMLRRDVLRASGGYRLGEFPEDYELWLRLHRQGQPMAKLPRTLLAWREWPQRTSRTDPRCSRDAFDALRARYLARDPRLDGRRDLAIWGAGRRTRQRTRPLLAEGVDPIAWVDIDPRKIGNIVWGRPVVSQDWLRRRPKPFVLVYVSGHGAREDVARRLAGLGYLPGEDYLAVG